MKTKHISLYIIMALSISTSSSAFDPTEEELIRMEIERLEQVCEVARENILAPERAALIEECNINKSRAKNNYCENFYSTHGDRTGNRPALYYDLPECIEAFEYRKNNK